MRHFLTLNDFSENEIMQMLNLAEDIKKEAKSRIYKPYLKDQILAMIFEKSSTRTRVSFEVGMHQLGGKAMFLSSNDLQIGRGEPIKDTARVISRMCDMTMLRVNRHETLEEFAKFSRAPVINGLSDKFHPVQLMADMLTAIECGLNLKTMKVAYVGDGNNMTHSWLMAASKLGFELRVATPRGYEPDADITAQAFENAKISGAKIYLTQDIKEAVANADVVTTDTWVFDGSRDRKRKAYKRLRRVLRR